MAVMQELRKLMVGAILATDMQGHFALSSEVRRTTSWTSSSLEGRQLLVKAIVHAADLANPTRPFPINCFMSAAIHREFA